MVFMFEEESFAERAARDARFRDMLNGNLNLRLG